MGIQDEKNPDGSVNKYKACLVAKGYHELPGKDINGFLQEDIYTTQPPGFVAKDKTLVCNLQRSLYGLKQTPCAWSDRLRKFLVQYGFKTSSCDHSLFIYHTTGVQLYVYVYVDDILVTGSAPWSIQDILDKSHATFALKHPDQSKYFMDLEVTQWLNSSYSTKVCPWLAACAKMTGCKGVVTPMLTTTKLNKHGPYTFIDMNMYRSVVRALQYIILTCPELSYSVNKACQFLSEPLDSHWKPGR